MPRWFSTETVARRVGFLLTGRYDDLIDKKDCYTGQTHVQQSFLVQKKTDGTLCNARYPGLPMPFPYSRQRRNCDASRNFIDCNPQKARRRKSRQQGTVHFCTAQKSKGRQPVYTHRRLFFHPATKLLKRGVFPSHRNVTMSARKASFTGFSIAELRFCCTKIVIF